LHHQTFLTSFQSSVLDCCSLPVRSSILLNRIIKQPRQHHQGYWIHGTGFMEARSVYRIAVSFWWGGPVAEPERREVGRRLGSF